MTATDYNGSPNPTRIVGEKWSKFIFDTVINKKA